MNDEVVRVDDHPLLVRSKTSRAILNTDTAALIEYKKKKALDERVNYLSEEITEIKQLLNRILLRLDR